MINKYGIKLLATVVSATFVTNAVAATNSTMTRDEWLSKLKDAVPPMICKNFTENESINKQLITAKIDYTKCLTLIPPSVHKCQTQYLKDIPETIDETAAQIWGSAIGKCIGLDFVSTHLSAMTPSDSSRDTETMPKDEWLSKLKTAVPDLICKGFLEDAELGKRLAKLDINFEKCVTLIPKSVDVCEKENYDALPATMNKDSADKWGHTMGECIGKNFAISYLIPDNKPAENSTSAH